MMIGSRCRLSSILSCRGIRSQAGRLRRDSASPNEQTNSEQFELMVDELHKLEEETIQKQQHTEISKKCAHKPKSKDHIKNIMPVRNGPLLKPITPEDQYEHLSQLVTPLCQKAYLKQLKIKEQQMCKIVKFLTKRLGDYKAPIVRTTRGLACQLESPRPSPELIAYRNKDEFGIQVGVDGNPKTVGFFVGRPTDPLMVCIPPTYLINIRESHKHIARSFQNFIRQSTHRACLKFDDGGIWRSIMVRSTESAEKMVTVYIHPQQLPEEGIQEIMEELRKYFFEGEGSECELDSLYLQACKHTRCTREQAPYRLIAGKEHITETCCDLKFQISPDSFFQINTQGAEVLYRTVQEVAEVSPITTVLDVCCGTGTISLVMAPRVRGTIGIDEITGAVEDATKNAQTNNITNSSFIAGKAEKILPRLSHSLRHCSDVLAVVNPARSGLHPDVIQTIRQCDAINKLVYVTCKPQGFAMENFIKLGTTVRTMNKRDRSAPFIPKYAVPVDLFPHTDHTELVLLFERVDA
ncbi:tRNA (uracil-5-)-methyltransferase homolog B isoform X2 [Procambarus clarkii]|uniref:tRNA (uracil-5-)-methyltransferase homolog B isoform X2 n=1 Tax=Procambarus clarkii TaxID=6728 RepID=UPI001E673AB2|nr:tRNA (uracil(54)-C(5))-methyltransferase homolog-B-like isoform X2 [Procambarus clarkii]